MIADAMLSDNIPITNRISQICHSSNNHHYHIATIYRHCSDGIRSSKTNLGLVWRNEKRYFWIRDAKSNQIRCQKHILSSLAIGFGISSGSTNWRSCSCYRQVFYLGVARLYHELPWHRPSTNHPQANTSRYRHVLDLDLWSIFIYTNSLLNSQKQQFK